MTDYDLDNFTSKDKMCGQKMNDIGEEKSDFLTTQTRNDENEMSFQKIIKINLLSDEDRDTSSGVETGISAQDFVSTSKIESKDNNDLQKLTPDSSQSQISEKISETDSKDLNSFQDVKETLRRSTSEIKDLVEEGQDLNAKRDIETKLETVYENGRVIEDDDHFEVILNVKKFLHGSMSVKSKGHHTFVVEAEADDKEDPGNKIYLTRRFFIPGRVDMQRTSTSLSSDGILVISVPKLPELKIPKRSDNLSYENTETVVDSSVKNDLESRFRNSDEKIRTESPSKLDELEARIKARKEAYEATKKHDEETKRSYREKEDRDIFSRDDSSHLKKNKQDQSINIEVKNTQEDSSQLKKTQENDDFFQDREWNSRKKKEDSDDWVRECVGKYLKEDDWFGSDSKEREFFNQRKEDKEESTRKKDRSEWKDSVKKTSFEDKFFDTKDIFGSRLRKFFSDETDNDKLFESKRNRSFGQNVKDENAFSCSKDVGFDFNQRRSSRKDSFEDSFLEKGAGKNQQFYTSSEAKHHYSSSSVSDDSQRSQPESKSFKKQEFSSSSKSKSGNDVFDDSYSSVRTDSDSRKKKLDELKDSFRKDSDFSFDFPIIRRGRFFQDDSFIDAKEDFDSVLDRFREKKSRFSKKDSDFNFSRNLFQENKRQKTVISEDDTCFKIEVPVTGVKEDTLSVKELPGNEISIEGEMTKSDERFKKQILFPIHGLVNIQNTTSALTHDDILVVRIPKMAPNIEGIPSDPAATSCSSITSDFPTSESTTEGSCSAAIAEDGRQSYKSENILDKSSFDRPVPRSRRSSRERVRNNSLDSCIGNDCSKSEKENICQDDSNKNESKYSNFRTFSPQRFSPTGVYQERKSPDGKCFDRIDDDKESSERESFFERTIRSPNPDSSSENQFYSKLGYDSQNSGSQTYGSQNSDTRIYGAQSSSAQSSDANNSDVRSFDELSSRKTHVKDYLVRQSPERRTHHACSSEKDKNVCINCEKCKCTERNFNQLNQDNYSSEVSRSVFGSDFNTFRRTSNPLWDRMPEDKFSRRESTTLSNRHDDPWNRTNRSRDNFIQREIDSFFGRGVFDISSSSRRSSKSVKKSDNFFKSDPFHDDMIPSRMKNKINSFFEDDLFAPRLHHRMESNFFKSSNFSSSSFMDRMHGSAFGESKKCDRLSRSNFQSDFTTSGSSASDFESSRHSNKTITNQEKTASVIRPTSPLAVQAVQNSDDIWYTVEIPVLNLIQDSLSVTDLQNNEILVEGKLTNGEAFKEKIFFPHYCNTKKAESILSTRGVLVVKVPKSLR